MNICNHHEYYDQKAAEVDQRNEIWIDEERLAIITDLIRRFHRREDNRRQTKIIDVGCGKGWLSEQLREYGDVLGVDYSNGMLEIARKRFPAVNFMCVDMLDDEETRQLGIFDVAVVSEVIEHIPDEHKPAFASRLSRLLRSGGTLIITIPNRLVWDYYWELSWSTQYKQPVEDWCTPSELRSLLKPHFHCLHTTTFSLTYTNRGIYGYLNSSKLNRLFSIIGLSSVFEGIKTARYGLHIAAAFRKGP